MAGVITHIVFSHKLFDTLLAGKDHKQFILGTSFPDIRHLGVIERSATHVENPSLDMVQSESDSFKSGMQYHALIDHVRSDYVRASGVLEQLPVAPLTQHALKLHEDIWIYQKVRDWGLYHDYFNEIIPEERRFHIPEAKLLEWHAIIQEATHQQPTEETMRSLLAKLGFTPEHIEEVKQTMEKVRVLPKLEDYLNELYVDLETMLTNFVPQAAN